ncbi:MAG: MotA/TolQ/ExbB proton channel family protein [Elusimicrobia bacterium]|nr:MotA/TolQ/ExbB proton channel family protein [Elusimicrobiota bacterium]
MDLMTILGTVVGLGVVISILAAGHMTRFLLNGDAIVLIFGGTLGSIMLSYPWSALQQVPNAVKMMVFPPKRPAPNLLITAFVRLAETVRRSGVEALAGELRAMPHPFMQDCLQMLVDGLDEDTVSDRCQRDIAATRHRHMQVSGIFRSAGTYSPIFGLLGTLIGVVQVLGNITNTAKIGSSMAVAMTASFYGIFAANFFFLPIANKLNFYSDEEVLSRELIAKGTLCLARGEVPWLIAKKLEAYLSFQLRQGGAKGYRVPA